MLKTAWDKATAANQRWEERALAKEHKRHADRLNEIDIEFTRRLRSADFLASGSPLARDNTILQVRHNLLAPFTTTWCELRLSEDFSTEEKASIQRQISEWGKADIDRGGPGGDLWRIWL